MDVDFESRVKYTNNLVFNFESFKLQNYDLQKCDIKISKHIIININISIKLVKIICVYTYIYDVYRVQKYMLDVHLRV